MLIRGRPPALTATADAPVELCCFPRSHSLHATPWGLLLQGGVRSQGLSTSCASGSHGHLDLCGRPSEQLQTLLYGGQSAWGGTLTQGMQGARADCLLEEADSFHVLLRIHLLRKVTNCKMFLQFQTQPGPLYVRKSHISETRFRYLQKEVKQMVLA